MRHEPLPRRQPSGDLMPPEDIYAIVLESVTEKCGKSAFALLFFGIAGGAMIALGALLYIAVITDSGLTNGVEKLIGGMSFSLGLILISITGAELFTGNVLALLGLAHNRISVAQLATNWGLVYAGNIMGAGIIGVTAAAAGLFAGSMGETLQGISQAKATLPTDTAFFRGLLCNVLVCLAIWTSLGARSTSGRVLCIMGPVAAFVALGLEHSIANIAFFAAALFAGLSPPNMGMIWNVVVVTLGNTIGAALLCLVMARAFAAKAMQRVGST